MKRLAIVWCAAVMAAGGIVALAQEPADSVGRIRSRLDEVVVTGSNDAVGRSLLPYTVSTVAAGQITATGRPQLLSAISGMVPSLFVSERNIFGFGISNGGAGGIKIRGVGGQPTNAVLMMVDGQPQFAGVFSHHVADFYSADYVERVEVLRGPASVLYGSNAMGGVINVITKNATESGTKTKLQSQYGSYNTWLTSLTNISRFGKFSSLVALAYDRTDGLRRNFDFNQANGYVKLGYDFSSHWKLLADYSLMRFKGKDPIYARLRDPESTAVYRQTVVRGEASATVVNSYGGTGGTLRVYYSYGNHIVRDPNRFRSLDNRLGVIAFQSFAPWTDASATIGFDFDRYMGKVPVSGGNVHRPGSMATMDWKTITEYSPYLTLMQRFWADRIILNAGLRMANSDKFATTWIPQAGVVVHPGMDWSIKASLARGYRNPSFRELYLYRQANPDLSPENMMNYEVTLGRSFGRWFGFDLTAYLSKGTDMIQVVDQKNVNTGKFTNKGIEFSAHSHPVDCLHLRASYSYLHTSLRDLTAAPRHQYFIGAGVDIIKGLRVDADLKGVVGLFVAEEMTRENYATMNMRIAYQPIHFLEIFVNLDNITSASYQINRGYPMPGFTVMGGFSLTL